MKAVKVDFISFKRVTSQNSTVVQIKTVEDLDTKSINNDSSSV